MTPGAEKHVEGLPLRPTRMLIAGIPKAGTPLIEAAPTSVAYNDPQFLGRRHGLPAELIRNIAGLGALVEKAAGEGP
jgi:hypothetical protein